MLLELLTFGTLVFIAGSLFTFIVISATERMLATLKCLTRNVTKIGISNVEIVSKNLQQSRFLSHYSQQHLTRNDNKLKFENEKETENDPDCEGESDPFLRNEIKKYNLGKRWLARMMGKDPETFTQEDIDESIQYLLPSHLWAKDARPMLKHPYELFPKTKKSEYDMYDRPISAAFYTGRPKYYDLTYKVWELMENMDNGEPIVFEKDVNASADSSEPKLKQWMKQFQLEQKLNEKLNETLYNTIMFRLKKLSQHQRGNEIQEFLSQFQVPVYTPGKEDLKEVDIYESVARAMGYRKTAIAEVIVKEGSGNITVNNKNFLDYFFLRNDREQIMFPLLLTNTLDRFDIETYVIGGGTSGKSGAIRLGISRAIAALCPEHFDALNSNKLLIRDIRQKERKKPGRKRARRAFQWVKR